LEIAEIVFRIIQTIDVVEEIVSVPTIATIQAVSGALTGASHRQCERNGKYHITQYLLLHYCPFHTRDQFPL
jgi:hypothetical protein